MLFRVSTLTKGILSVLVSVLVWAGKGMLSGNLVKEKSVLVIPVLNETQSLMTGEEKTKIWPILPYPGCQIILVPHTRLWYQGYFCLEDANSWHFDVEFSLAKGIIFTKTGSANDKILKLWVAYFYPKVN